LEKKLIRVKWTAMAGEKKSCMICGKPAASRGGICDPCQDRIRREALGEQASQSAAAEKALKKHGVTPAAPPKKG
jgi:hypothetical protein